MSFLSDAGLTVQALQEYYEESSEARQPVLQQKPLGQVIEQLGLEHYAREGGLSGAALSEFLQRYFTFTNRLHHPGFLGHQVAVPYYSGALGSLIDGFTGNSMAIYETGPGATSIEYFVINWMLEKVGWQPMPLDMHRRLGAGGDRTAGGESFGAGILTHGGSLANLTGLLAARNRAAPDAWQQGAPADLAMLVPPVAHYSMARAAGILGIGQQAIIPLEVDERGAVILDRLPAALERAHSQGRRVMAVVANACSTAVGIYDPLEEIGAFCRQHDLWLHVDGAHGASALLSAKHRARLKGLAQADSLAWDAHKMLQTPALCAALLVRDHRTLDGAFQQEASYLFHERELLGIDQSPRTLECTKAGLGLKLFLVVGALGERGLAETLEGQYALARQAYEYINRQPGFTCAVAPESNILCFRVEGSDQHQLELRDAVIAEGQYYLSSTVFRGQRWLRIVVMNPHSGMAQIEGLIAASKQANG